MTYVEVFVNSDTFQVFRKIEKYTIFDFSKICTKDSPHGVDE